MNSEYLGKKNKQTYIFFVSSCIFLFLFTLSQTLLKLFANNFRGIKNYPPANYFFNDILKLDITKHQYLSNLSWKVPYVHRYQFEEHYLNYVVLLFVICALSLIFKSSILKYINVVNQWRFQPDFKREKNIILFFLLLGFFTFFMRLNFGFFSHGIIGWTFKKKDYHEVSYQKSDAQEKHFELLKKHPWLKQALKDNIPQVYRSTDLVVTPVYFLFYKEPEVIKIASEKLQGIWTDNGYWPFLIEKAPKDFFKIVKRSLKSWQRSFLGVNLEKYNYIPHRNFDFIDYSQYPSPDKLSKIKLFTIHIRVFNNQETYITDLKTNFSISNPNETF